MRKTAFIVLGISAAAVLLSPIIWLVGLLTGIGGSLIHIFLILALLGIPGVIIGVVLLLVSGRSAKS